MLEERGRFYTTKLEEYMVEWKKKQVVQLCLMACQIRKGDPSVFFLVSNPKGTIFQYSIDTSNISKIAKIVCQMLDEVVDRVEEENVIQVVIIFWIWNLEFRKHFPYV